MPASNHTPEGMYREMFARLRDLERRPTSGGSSAFVLPDRLGPQGELATDCNATLTNGSYRGVAPVNAPLVTPYAQWDVYVAGNGSTIYQEFRHMLGALPGQPPGNPQTWVRLSSDGGATFSDWYLYAGGPPIATDLSAFVVSGGTLFGNKNGRHRELYGTGHTAASGTAPVAAWNALPVDWRPLGTNRHGMGYSANWPVGVIMRPDGTGAFGNRVSGATLTTIQFSIEYMV